MTQNLQKEPQKKHLRYILWGAGKNSVLSTAPEPFKTYVLASRYRSKLPRRNCSPLAQLGIFNLDHTSAWTQTGCKRISSWAFLFKGLGPLFQVQFGFQEVTAELGHGHYLRHSHRRHCSLTRTSDGRDRGGATGLSNDQYHLRHI